MTVLSIVFFQWSFYEPVRLTMERTKVVHSEQKLAQVMINMIKANCFVYDIVPTTRGPYDSGVVWAKPSHH
jgi:hypothetical protein